MTDLNMNLELTKDLGVNNDVKVAVASSSQTEPQNLAREQVAPPAESKVTIEPPVAEAQAVPSRGVLLNEVRPLVGEGSEPIYAKKTGHQKSSPSGKRSDFPARGASKKAGVTPEQRRGRKTPKGGSRGAKSSGAISAQLSDLAAQTAGARDALRELKEEKIANATDLVASGPRDSAPADKEPEPCVPQEEENVGHPAPLDPQTVSKPAKEEDYVTSARTFTYSRTGVLCGRWWIMALLICPLVLIGLMLTIVIPFTLTVATASELHSVQSYCLPVGQDWLPSTHYNQRLLNATLSLVSAATPIRLTGLKITEYLRYVSRVFDLQAPPTLRCVKEIDAVSSVVFAVILLPVSDRWVDDDVDMTGLYVMLKLQRFLDYTGVILPIVISTAFLLAVVAFCWFLSRKAEWLIFLEPVHHEAAVDRHVSSANTPDPVRSDIITYRRTICANNWVTRSCLWWVRYIPVWVFELFGNKTLYFVHYGLLTEMLGPKADVERMTGDEILSRLDQIVRMYPKFMTDRDALDLSIVAHTKIIAYDVLLSRKADLMERLSHIDQGVSVFR